MSMLSKIGFHFYRIAVILKLAVQRVSNDMGTVTQILGGHSTMDPPSLLPAGGVPRRWVPLGPAGGSWGNFAFFP